MPKIAQSMKNGTFVKISIMLSPSPRSCFAFNNFVCKRVNKIFKITGTTKVKIKRGDNKFCGDPGDVCPNTLCIQPDDWQIPKAKTSQILEEFKAMVIAAKPDFKEPYNKHKGNIIAIGDSDIIVPKTQADVIWDMVRNCNWDCSYCNPSWRSPRSTNLKSPYEVKQFFLKIKLPKSNNIVITISGGEPTMFPELDKITKWLLQHNNNIKKVIIATNGSAKYHVLERLCKDAHLLITLHNEYVTSEQLDKLLRLRLAYPERVSFKIMEKANKTITDFAQLVGSPEATVLEDWQTVKVVTMTDTTLHVKRVTV